RGRVAALLRNGVGIPDLDRPIEIESTQLAQEDPDLGAVDSELGVQLAHHGRASFPRDLPKSAATIVPWVLGGNRLRLHGLRRATRSYARSCAPLYALVCAEFKPRRHVRRPMRVGRIRIPCGA